VYDFTDKPLTIDDLQKQIETIKNPVDELKSLEYHQAHGLQEYETFRGSVQDEEFKKLIEIVHYFSYLKEMRDDYRRHAYYLWLPFWGEIAQRIHLTIEQANHLL